MRATDRARKWMVEWSADAVSAGIGSDQHHAAMREIGMVTMKAFPAALDFADAVEAALDQAHIPERRAHLCREALRAFLAQLDRATGGGA